MVDERRPVVAVVDDDDDVRDSLQFLLEIAGYDVLAYESAQSCLDGLDTSAPACLILDQHMPTMSGIELLGRLRQMGVTLPTALITGSPSAELRHRAESLGAVRLLEKPLADDALLSFVQAAISGTLAR